MRQFGAAMPLKSGPSRRHKYSGYQVHLLWSPMKRTTSRVKRRRRQTSAWITVDGQFANRECKLLDISETGAKLQLDPSIDEDLSEFWLTKVPRSKVKTLCSVVWRRGSTAGVKFVEWKLPDTLAEKSTKS